MSDAPAWSQPVRDWILGGLRRESVPALAVAVAWHGEILWEEGFGWADRERGIPATPHTPFPVASVSKPITATALMKLAETGRVDLDRPVDDYLPPGARMNVWTGEASDVTPRRLASHTAGLPGHARFYRGEALRRMPPMEEAIRRHGNIITPPGERYRYANFGYGILDYVIGRVSGEGFNDYLRKEIFLPLGMRSSFVEPLPGQREAAAVCYEAGGGLTPEARSHHAGASAVWSSAHDLLRFGLFHAGTPLPDQHPVLNGDSLRVMRERCVDMKNVPAADLNLRADSGYGLGWVVDDDAVDHRISHGGGMDGAAAKLLFLPEEGIVIATASNQFHPLAYQVEWEILTALAPGYAERFRAFDAAKRAAGEAPAKSRDFKAAGLLGVWRGEVRTYEKSLPFTLEFQPDGTVRAQLAAQLHTLVNDARLVGNHLTGRMAGSVETEDALATLHHPNHHLQLDLFHRGGTLDGAVMAVAGTFLGFWACLRREG